MKHVEAFRLALSAVAPISAALPGVTVVFAPPGESPVPSVSSGASSPLSASVAAPTMVQTKPSSASHQDRKVPQPIGTERLARIRQTGSVNPPMLTTNYTPPVGQGGIWSFGVGSASGEEG